MGWPKGKPRGIGKGNTGKGRKKGSKNRVRKAILDELDEIDGKLELGGKGLLDIAMADPKWYYENFKKQRVPKNLDVNVGGELKISWQK